MAYEECLRQRRARPGRRMQIQDWLIRPGPTHLEGAPSPLRVQELLPVEGISIGPPGAEDRVEISAMAHMLLQASDQLAGAEDARVERIHAEYLRGHREPDPERLAARLVESMAMAGSERRERAHSRFSHAGR